MNTKKTLADVKPGGRVRLGDRLPPLPYPNYPVSKTGLQNNAYTASQMWDYARAALSAQPSPGGQDALDCIGRIEEAIEFRVPHDIYAAVHGELAELKAALAALQPSKQPDSVALGEATEFCIEKGDRQPVGEPVGWYTEDHLTDRSATTYDRTVADRWRAKGWPVSPLYAAPTAQAVDLDLQLDRYDAGLLGDGGGGDVGWWQDYIRAELDRAHEFYQDQADSQAVGNG